MVSRRAVKNGREGGREGREGSWRRFSKASPLDVTPKLCVEYINFN